MASTLGSELTSDPAFEMLSPWDRELVCRLKQTYPPDVLSELFSDMPTRHNSLTSRSTRSSIPRSSKSSLSSTGWHRITSQRSSVSTCGTGITIPSIGPGSLTSESVFCFEAVAEEAERPRTAVDVQRASQAYLNGIAELARMGESNEQSGTIPKQETPLESRIIYVCTSCGDAFEELATWKDHEKRAHELEYYWPCPHPSCKNIFSTANKFENHHHEAHGCHKCPHADEVVRRLPPKRAWGCGFDLCHGSFTNWDQRCAHIAAHYEGFAEHRGSQGRYPHWRYTNMIRNLLRQPAIKDAFRQYMIRRHGESMVSWPKLRWKPKGSSELKRRLEYCDFRHGVEEIVQLAYRLGHPANSKSQSKEGMRTNSTASVKPTHKRSGPSLSLFPPCDSYENVFTLATQDAQEELPSNPIVRPLESRVQIPHESTATGRPLQTRATSLSSSSHDLIRSPPRSPSLSPVPSHTSSILTVPELSSDGSSVLNYNPDNIGLGSRLVRSSSKPTFATTDTTRFNSGLPTEVYVIHRPTNPLPLPSPTLSQFPIPPKTPKELLKRAKSLVRR